MSGDIMCDLCSSHAEYINPETHRTLILCSPMRTKAGATCLQNKKKSPQARYESGWSTGKNHTPTVSSKMHRAFRSVIMLIPQVPVWMLEALA